MASRLQPDADVADEAPAARIATTLRDEIYAGDPEPGTPLREEALRSRFGVSRYVIRAALTELADRGLVVHRPNRGFAVRVLDADDVVDLFEVRRALELAAIRVVDRREPSLAPMREAADRLEHLERLEVEGRATKTGSLTADLEFHRSLVVAAGSPRLLAAYDAIQTELRLCYARMAVTTAPVVGEHRTLYLALSTKDVAGAQGFVETHLRDGMRDTLRALEGARGSGRPAGAQPSPP
jgi:DNA-binding GntR family transcriptional regulator